RLIGKHDRIRTAPKGLAGQQKDNRANVGALYAPVFKAINVEGDFNVGKVHLTPGVAALNRTLDQRQSTNL
ncbi:MAG: hypothetical protein QM743_09400, partial [Chitinophagaceae bacterium]